MFTIICLRKYFQNLPIFTLQSPQPCEDDRQWFVKENQTEVGSPASWLHWSQHLRVFSGGDAFSVRFSCPWMRYCCSGQCGGEVHQRYTKDTRIKKAEETAAVSGAVVLILKSERLFENIFHKKSHQDPESTNWKKILKNLHNIMFSFQKILVFLFSDYPT